MRNRISSIAMALSITACAGGSYFDPLVDYEQVSATTILDAPTPTDIAPENVEVVSRGEYLVELLGCGACHTDGALIGEPNMQTPLGGSRIGIAYTNPLRDRYPGVVYAPNITPDDETGIGRWTDQQITDAVRAGIGRHGDRRILVMPWQGYAQISSADARAIVAYLRSIKPVRHAVPGEVPPGTRASQPYVHFGVYRSRELVEQ